MSEYNSDGWKIKEKKPREEVPEIETTKVEIVGARIPFGQMIIIIFKGFFAFLLALILASFLVFFITTALGLSLGSFFLV